MRQSEPVKTHAGQQTGDNRHWRHGLPIVAAYGFLGLSCLGAAPQAPRARKEKRSDHGPHAPSSSSRAFGGRTGHWLTLFSGTPALARASQAAASWTPTTFSLPGAAHDPDTDILGVACPVGSSCVADGDYTLSDGHTAGFVASGEGKSWSAVEAPLPAGAARNPEVSLGGVTCADATHCVVVGKYETSTGWYEGVLLSGSGKSWTAAEAPLPAGVASSGISVWVNALACASADVCTAVGITAMTPPPPTTTASC